VFALRIAAERPDLIQHWDGFSLWNEFIFFPHDSRSHYLGFLHSFTITKKWIFFFLLNLNTSLISKSCHNGLSIDAKKLLWPWSTMTDYKIIFRNEKSIIGPWHTSIKVKWPVNLTFDLQYKTGITLEPVLIKWWGF
jgi:hypothetical protein